MADQFNIDNWPIVYFELGNQKLDDNTFEEYQKYYLTLLIRCKKNNEKMVVISNLSSLNNTENIEMRYIMKQMQFNRKIYDFNKKYVKCVCILCKNKSFKNILNTVFSLTKPAAPFKLCRSTEKANTYLLEKFDIKFDINIFENNQEFEIDNNIEEEFTDNNIFEIKTEIIEAEDDNKKIFSDYFDELLI